MGEQEAQFEICLKGAQFSGIISATSTYPFFFYSD
jgi:hypothetical protein